jgi:hypothetical protein
VSFVVHAFELKIGNHKEREGTKKNGAPEARRFHCSSRRLYAASFVASDLTGERSLWARTTFICFQS